MQVVEPAAQLLADARVQRAERLVQQQHLRPRRERPCQRHALALPAGELVGIPVRERCQLHQLEQLVHALALRAAFDPLRTDRPNATFSRTVMCRNSA